jgi:hypothetical protein
MLTPVQHKGGSHVTTAMVQMSSLTKTDRIKLAIWDGTKAVQKGISALELTMEAVAENAFSSTEVVSTLLDVLSVVKELQETESRFWELYNGAEAAKGAIDLVTFAADAVTALGAADAAFDAAKAGSDEAPDAVVAYVSAMADLVGHVPVFGDAYSESLTAIAGNLRPIVIRAMFPTGDAAVCGTAHEQQMPKAMREDCDAVRRLNGE